MNNRIKAYIDGLFAGVALEGEAAELHDELCANCTERFDDLISQGYSEDEAFEFVREGMGDVNELIAPYRRGGTHAHPPRQETETVPYFEQAFDVEGIRCLNIESRDASISVVVNSGEQLVVIYEADGRGEGFTPPEIALEDGTLRVSVQKREAFSFTLDLEATVQSLVNMITGKGVRGARLTLAVPQGMMPLLEVHGGSGSLHVEGIALRGADVHLASGSIRMEPDARVRGGVYELHTASGSVRCTAAADEITLNSMSGSVKAICDARSLRANAVSGSVRVEGHIQSIGAKSVSGSVHVSARDARVTDIQAHAVSGSVHVAVPEQIAGFTLSARSVSGRVHNAFGADVYGDGMTRIEASSTSGSVHLEKL